MPQIKAILLLADLLGISATILGIVKFLGTVESALMLVVVGSYWFVRLYYTVKQKEQAIREKNLELEHKEMDLKERKARLK